MQRYLIAVQYVVEEIAPGEVDFEIDVVARVDAPATVDTGIDGCVRRGIDSDFLAVAKVECADGHQIIAQMGIVIVTGPGEPVERGRAVVNIAGAESAGIDREAICPKCSCCMIVERMGRATERIPGSAEKKVAVPDAATAHGAAIE